jgi:hypothetical protein
MDTIKFPRTYDVRSIIEQASTESKKITQPAKFLASGKLSVDSFNDQKFDIIKSISIKTKKPNNFNTISLLINDYIVCKTKSDTENRNTFTFDSFISNGIVQVPKLFDINFICNPFPSNDIDVELTYYGVSLEEEVKDYMLYNQYYSIHKVNKMSQNDEEFVSKGSVLAIYYAPAQITPYNVKFIELKDIPEFMNVIQLDYIWKCPSLYEFKGEMKKEIHRLISVECDLETEKLMNKDEVLNFESRRIVLEDGKISKNYVVHVSVRRDIESHILSEYGLIPFISIIEIPKAEIDYTKMSKIFNNILTVLKKIEPSYHFETQS